MRLARMDRVPIRLIRNRIVRTCAWRARAAESAGGLLLDVGADDSLLLTIPVPVLFGIALIMGFLAHR